MGATGIAILYLILSVIWLAILIRTLWHQAMRKRIYWFVFTVLFQVTLIVYWIVLAIDPKLRKKKGSY